MSAHAYDNAEEARQEAVDKRAQDLIADRMSDDKRVQEAICDALGNDCDDAFAPELRRFFTAFDAAQTDDGMADAGNALFIFLRQQVRPRIRADAMLEAQAEQARFEANAQ